MSANNHPDLTAPHFYAWLAPWKERTRSTKFSSNDYGTVVGWSVLVRMIGRVAEWMLMVGVMSPAILWAAAPQASVGTGVIEGKREGSVNAFLGIPYAAAPVGELRWRPPAAPPKWDGIRNAKEFGNGACKCAFLMTWCFAIRGRVKTVLR
jgi:hypothetical protein